MVGQAIWRSCALVLTGGIPSQLCGPRLGSLRSSLFSEIAVWKNSRLNSLRPRYRYRWRQLHLPIFKPPRPAGSRVQKNIFYIVCTPVYRLILRLDHHGNTRWHPDTFRLSCRH